MDVAGREPVPIARQAARTQAAGTGDHVPARVGARQGSYPRDLPEHHRMGTGPAWPAPRGTPLFRSRTARADAGRDGLPSRDHPGPTKYQSSFAHGMPGPGLRSLIDELLAKLRAVDAIGEEEYRRARGEPIVVGGGRPPGRPPSGVGSPLLADPLTTPSPRSPPPRPSFYAQ